MDQYQCWSIIVIHICAHHLFWDGRMLIGTFGRAPSASYVFTSFLAPVPQSVLLLCTLIGTPGNTPSIASCTPATSVMYVHTYVPPTVLRQYSSESELLPVLVMYSQRCSSGCYESPRGPGWSYVPPRGPGWSYVPPRGLGGSYVPPRWSAHVTCAGTRGRLLLWLADIRLSAADGRGAGTRPLATARHGTQWGQTTRPDRSIQLSTLHRQMDIRATYEPAYQSPKPCTESAA